jgi:hypothetical protein
MGVRRIGRQTPSSDDGGEVSDPQSRLIKPLLQLDSLKAGLLHCQQKGREADGQAFAFFPSNSRRHVRKERRD